MNIKNLVQSDVGRKVVYNPFKDCNPDQRETGVITSWNDKFIFVRYSNASTCGISTTPSDIEFEVGG